MSQMKKSYSFKGVGQLKTDVDDLTKDTAIVLPIGIKTPISFSQTGNSMFDMSYDIGTQIRDNLRNLLLTNSGERLMMSDLGANLKELAYDLSSEEVVSEAIRRIATTVSKYMPYVDLQTFEPRTEKSEEGETILSIIKVVYNIPTAGLINQALEMSLVVAS